MIKNKWRSVGDTIRATLFSHSGDPSQFAVKHVKGRITCFYDASNEIDIRDSKGHMWKVRAPE